MDFHPGGDLLSIMERNEGGMSELDARSVCVCVCGHLRFKNGLFLPVPPCSGFT